MLCLKSLPSIQRPFFPSRRPRLSLPRRLSLSAMSSTVEHVVLFQVKPQTDPSLVDSMLSNLRSLSTLPGVSHLSCAPILRNHNAPFTHLLHSRYPSKPDLAAYSAHPSHLSVVRSFVLPICDDIMSLDWLADLDPSRVPLAPGAAAKITFAKLREEAGEAEKAEVLRVIGGGQGVVRAAQISFGENFSPGRAKGYSIALMAVFDGPEEMATALADAEAAVEEEKEKVRELLESVIAVEFVVPSVNPASL